MNEQDIFTDAEKIARKVAAMEWGMISPIPALAAYLLAMIPVVRLVERYAGADLVSADIQAALDAMRKELAQ